jgi:hypothetical protein
MIYLESTPKMQTTTNGSTNLQPRMLHYHYNVIKVWALLSGATSYRKVHAIIQAHYKTLDAAFDLNWKKLPAYTTLRDIIQGTSSAEIEACFRVYSAHLAGRESENAVQRLPDAC